MNARNILWNLLGLGLPLLIAVLTVPKLISIVGSERFGFLALAWGLIGYAGILDLGIGRAVTQKVAYLRDSERESEIPDIIITAARITCFVGLVGFCLIATLAVLGGGDFIPHTEVSELELKLSILLLAFALPLQAVSATYKGINEAYLNFKGISLLRIALGAANFGGPFLVALYSESLYWLVATLVVSRAVAFFIYKRLARTCLPLRIDTASGKYSRSQARELFRFGGWLTVSSIISPFLVQADRFFVGALVSASAVTLYVIPYEITVQSLILVGAITTVAFPTISNLIKSDPAEAGPCFRFWLVRVAVVMAVAMLGLAALMPYILELWVGEHVDADSTRVGRLLCLGVLFNAIGAMFYSYLHAEGRVRETAILHILELPLFIVVLYFSVSSFGVVGAAIAWVVRVGFDAFALAFFSRTILGIK